MTPDLLDDLLDRSAPATRSANDADLSAMIRDAHVAARPARRKARTPILVGALVVLLTGGAGVAFATDAVPWQWWAENSPAAGTTFTLPSGVVCEARWGDFTTTDREAEQRLRDWLGEVDVLALADVQGEWERKKADTVSRILDDGTEVDASYGTEYWDGDTQYTVTVHAAVATLMYAQLEKMGYDLAAIDFSISGEVHCPGADE